MAHEPHMNIGWGPGSRTEGLLTFPLHSCSDHLFHKAGDLSVTNHGFIPCYSLANREKRDFLPASVTQGRTQNSLT